MLLPLPVLPVVPLAMISLLSPSGLLLLFLLRPLSRLLKLNRGIVNLNESMIDDFFVVSWIDVVCFVELTFYVMIRVNN